MNAKKIFFNLVLMVSVSCNRTMPLQIESPLATVIKLISSESFADFEEGKKYIDLTKVYSNNIDSLSPEQAWKNQVLFFYNIGKDKRFTNNFKYYNYSIREEQRGENAEVIFESIHPEDSISKILYSLTLYGETWVVVRIEYIKK